MIEVGTSTFDSLSRKVTGSGVFLLIETYQDFIQSKQTTLYCRRVSITEDDSTSNVRSFLLSVIYTLMCKLKSSPSNSILSPYIVVFRLNLSFSSFILSLSPPLRIFLYELLVFILVIQTRWNHQPDLIGIYCQWDLERIISKFIWTFLSLPWCLSDGLSCFVSTFKVFPSVVLGLWVVVF